MRTMRVFSTFRIFVAMLLVMAFLPACQSMSGRSAGRVIDDKAISAQVKTKLTADKASNLTRIGVTTINGVVHLDGVVDSSDDKARALDIARRVAGANKVVDNIQVNPTPAASPSGSTK